MPVPLPMEELISASKSISDAGFSIDPKARNTIGKAKLAALLGIVPGRAEAILRRLRGGDYGAPIQTDSDVVTGDTRVMTRIVDNRIATKADLIRVCEIDECEWSIKQWEQKAYQGFAKVGPKDNPHIDIVQMFAVRAILQCRTEVVDAAAVIADMKAEAKSAVALKLPRACQKRPRSGYTLEIDISDPHFGKLAWGKETGWSDWDSKICETEWWNGVESLIADTAHRKFDRVILVVGNDLLHSDNSAATTTRGTRVDVDSRWKKTYPAVSRTLVRTIIRLRSVAPEVLVVVMPGNHDNHSAFCIGDALELKFDGDPQVKIDNDPLPRKYFAFGQCMVVWEHGNLAKLKSRRMERPLMAAVERPDFWGSTAYRELHTGDKHHKYSEDVMGFVTRIVGALCPPDFWHSENGFVGSLRQAEAFIWHENMGVVGTAVYTIPPGRTLLKRAG